RDERDLEAGLLVLAARRDHLGLLDHERGPGLLLGALREGQEAHERTRFAAHRQRDARALELADALARRETRIELDLDLVDALDARGERRAHRAVDEVERLEVALDLLVLRRRERRQPEVLLQAQVRAAGERQELLAHALHGREVLVALDAARRVELELRPR